MKRRVIRTLSAVFLAVLLAAPVSAAVYSYDGSARSEARTAESWQALVDSLPENLRELASSLSPADPTAAADAIKERTGFSWWIGQIGGTLKEALASIFPSLAPLLSVLILSAVAVNMIPAVSDELSEAFARFARLITALVVFRSAVGMIGQAAGTVRMLCQLMNGLLPIMQLFSFGEGSVGTASMIGFMLSVTAAGNGGALLLEPAAEALFTWSSVAYVCQDVKTGGFTGAFRKAIQRLWQFVTVLFSFLLGIQSLLGRAADSLWNRTARFALSSMIPVAGPMLSEAFTTVRAGLGMLRSAAGAGGILLLLLLLLPGIVPLLVWQLYLSLTASCAELLGVDGKLIDDVKGVAELLTAAVLFTSLLFLFALIVFTGSSVR